LYPSGVLLSKLFAQGVAIARRGGSVKALLYPAGLGPQRGAKFFPPFLATIGFKPALPGYQNGILRSV